MANKLPHFPPRASKKGPFTVDAPGAPDIPGETKPRRNIRSPDKLVTQYHPGVDTLFKIVKYNGEHRSTARAMGYRKTIKKHQETKKIIRKVNGKDEEVDKTWTLYEKGEYNYFTWKEVETITHQVGAGLRKLGMEAGDRIHLFAATSAHWQLCAHGAFTQSMSIVTAYDTLGEEGLRHSLKITKPKTIFLEPHLIKLFTKTLNDVPSLQNVVYNTAGEEVLDENDANALKAAYPHIKLMTWDELRSLGEQNPVPLNPPGPTDHCCIMFTSGSGGPPKGVELTHESVVAAAAGGMSIVKEHLTPVVSYLAYLPLAHIFEFVFEHAVMMWGGLLGYGSVRTLSATNCRNCKGDIQEFKPVFLVGVPAVWETIKKGILANLAKASKPVQNLFWSAYYLKKNMTKWGIPGTPILDAIVFNKIKEATGGNLRMALSGGALIAKETQEFLSLTVCAVFNGYGLTETAAMGLINDPEAWSTEIHGEPPTAIEMKLVDWPEGNYLVTNKPRPQGEIWIRGLPIMKQYFELPELTEEAFGPGRWFKTGDIGQLEKDGQFTIIDRKKNLVKTLNGEYIAIEKLESVYRAATIVQNICIYASVDEVKPVAIIVPAEPALKTLAASIGVQGNGLEDLVHSKAVQDEVFKQLAAVGRKASLANIELIQGVVLSDEEWTPQNLMVTPTQKLNRPQILTKFKKEIATAYGKA